MKSFLSPTRGREYRDRSPFSSPYSNLLASPIAARRSSLEERRRPAARFKQQSSPQPTTNREGPSEDEEETIEEEQEDEEDDHAGELSPLLPIFSAEHLGIPPFSHHTSLLHMMTVSYRLSAGLQHYPYHTSPCCPTMRNHPLMGPASVPAGLPVSRQTDTAANFELTFLEGDPVCADGQLPPVQ